MCSVKSSVGQNNGIIQWWDLHSKSSKQRKSQICLAQLWYWELFCFLSQVWRRGEVGIRTFKMTRGLHLPTHRLTLVPVSLRTALASPPAQPRHSPRPLLPLCAVVGRSHLFAGATEPSSDAPGTRTGCLAAYFLREISENFLKSKISGNLPANFCGLCSSGTWCGLVCLFPKRQCGGGSVQWPPRGTFFLGPFCLLGICFCHFQSKGLVPWIKSWTLLTLRF